MKLFKKLRDLSKERNEKALRESLRQRVQLMEWGGMIFVSLDGLPIRQVANFEDIRDILEQTRSDLYGYLTEGWR